MLGEDFATELSERVSRIVSLPTPFTALAAGSDDSGRVSVAIRDDELKELSIPLTIAGRLRLRLLVKYKCCWDVGNDYLAVDFSAFHVRTSDKERDEPLFRYEYVRTATGGVPSAHIQLHAHRDEFVYLLAAADKGRPKRRQSEDRVPRLSEFHFPVGGHRFRPCIEDIFEAVVHEFGIDTVQGHQDAILSGRESWRRTQLKAAVRDAPQDAASVLEDLGWGVTPPATLPTDRIDRLQAF